ncbi:MAG: polyprenyl synthetase family protein [Treponema sp.]|nr:polyprenyl synthetase family protein [Treponema sp.]
MDQQYTRRLEKIETVLNRWLPENPASSNNNGIPWVSEVFPGLTGSLQPQLMKELTAPCRDLLARGGKRWRPLLMTLVCEALGGGDASLPLAPLVELCHTASLIHDDIEDNADERRGKPAVHCMYGVDTAINSGSFLYFLPLACIDVWAESDYKLRAQAYSLWAAYIRKLHLGQAIDIFWHRNFDIIPSVEEYHIMCALKTGCLARFAAELGALAAGADQMQGLAEAAEKLGVGFQILDDVKNLTTGLPGKKRGDDVAEGKKSLPVLLFLHRWPEKQKMISRCFTAARSGGAGVPEAEELMQALLAAGVLGEAEERGRALIAEARTLFSAAGFTLLSGLADHIS